MGAQHIAKVQYWDIVKYCKYIIMGYGGTAHSKGTKFEHLRAQLVRYNGMM
jgi:hypothetical protein